MAIARTRLIRQALKTKGAASAYTIFFAKSMKGSSHSKLSGASKQVSKKWAALTDAQKKPFQAQAAANSKARQALRKQLKPTNAYALFVKQNFKAVANGETDVGVVAKGLAKLWKAASNTAKTKLANESAAHNKRAAAALARF